MDAEAQGVAQQNGLLAARSQDVAPPAPTPAQVEYARAQARLDQVSAIYSDSHPDVVAARAALALAQAAVRRDPPPRSLTAPLEQEIASGRTRIAALAARRAALVAEVSRADRQVSLAPQATYELNNLQREYDNLKQQYQSIREKQLDAQVAVNLQVEGKGERFSVVDRATLPPAPVSPKRARLVTTGALVGIAVAIGVLLMWEMTMRPVHGPGAVVALTGEEPLAEIATLRAGPVASLRTRVARVLAWRRRAVPT